MAADHKPTAELIKRASAIADPDERRRVIGEIRELRQRYAGTDAEFKAPNGQPTGLLAAMGEELGQQAWYAVRTPSFKNWFGDWDRAARVEVFKNSQDVPLDGNEYQGKYELNKESILDYLKNTLSKNTMRNHSIVEDIRLGGTGIDKLIGWGMKNETYKKLFAHIPELTEKAVLLAEEKPSKTNAHYKKYTHLACGIEIDDKPHTVHIILGESSGQWYYSHILLDIEKGSLLAGIRQSTPGHPIHASFSDIKDTALLRLSQAYSSKITDENGEPLPVYRGDKPEMEMFDNPQGTSCAGDKTVAADYSSGGLYSLFLNIRDPLFLNGNNFIHIREQINDMLEEIYEKDESELEHDSQYKTLKKKYLAFRNEKGSVVRDFYNDFLPEVSTDMPLDDFKEILLKSVHDANAFEWRQIDYHDIDILNPFIQALGYDGIVRPYDPLGQARGNEFLAFDPSQIKSAIGNAGTYSRSDLSITDNASKLTITNKINKEKIMQIPISTQAEYDLAVKNKLHVGNELVIENTLDFITVRTDVTVGKNARCTTDDKSSITATVKENGILTAEGKTTVIGYDNANIIATNNCRITLHDSAFGNCYEHCHITLDGKSKISADGNCTVHAYDESAVSASGSSKVYTYQKATAKGTDVAALSGKGESTLYGQKNCSIMAKDNCIVYASDNCTVQAADNCLVVANKYSTVKAKDNCLIMSNENYNKNIAFSDKCEHLKLEDINDKNIMSALKQMAQSKAVVERPYVAIQILKDNIPQTRREAVNRRLNTMGLKDQTATKNYLFNLIEAEPGMKKQPPAQNLERQLETARKAGYVQGVCECVAVVGNEQNLGKKLLSEMQVTKDMAKKFANPETYKTLEKGIFAQKPEQKLEQTHGIKR